MLVELSYKELEILDELLTRFVKDISDDKARIYLAQIDRMSPKNEIIDETFEKINVKVNLQKKIRSLLGKE